MALASDDEPIDNAADVVNDLFGDDEETGSEHERHLSEPELDSSDDEGRNDRAHDKMDAKEVNMEGRTALIQDSNIGRHPLPRPCDRELNVLRLLKFLGIKPHPFDPKTFELLVSDHHMDYRSTNFSANATAMSTMRYHKNPASGKLESNTIVYRWSDRSTTISVGEQ